MSTLLYVRICYNCSVILYLFNWMFFVPCSLLVIVNINLLYCFLVCKVNCTTEKKKKNGKKMETGYDIVQNQVHTVFTSSSNKG